jgi:glucokinase
MRLDFNKNSYMIKLLCENYYHMVFNFTKDRLRFRVISSLPKGISYAITQLARDHGLISRAEIAHTLKMSPNTVGRIVDGLVVSHVLREVGQRQGKGAGRPSILLQFNSQISSVLTIDLRLIDAHAALTDLSGNVFAKCNRSLVKGNSQRSIIELTALIHEILDYEKNAPPVEVIVVGVPAITNIDEGIVEWQPDLDWINLPLKQILENEFQKTVFIENDLKLSVLGEYWKGAGEKTKNNLVYVSVGTGIGAGIIINGDLYRGTTCAAGEVAYFITDVNVLKDNIGRIGNLENRVGSEGLIRKAHLLAQRYPNSQLANLFSRNPGRVSPKDILNLAVEGDSAAVVVYNELVDILTIVAANISVVLDPEMVILGGPSDLNWVSIISSIQNRIGDSLLRPVNLIPSQLGADALIMGGVYTSLQFLEIIKRANVRN